MTGLLADDLVGTWRLLEWRAEADDGTSTRPFGDRPLGYVVYTADGHMITTISVPDRAPIGEELLAAPPDARAAAFETFAAYSGTFHVDGGEVVHEVEMSLYPDWIGSAQRRRVDLDATRTRLTLMSDPVTSAGRAIRNCLDWERVEA